MNRNIRSSQSSTLSKLLAKEKKHSSRDVSDETENKKLSEKMLMIVSNEASLNTVCGGYNGDESCDYLYSLSKFNHTLDNACNSLLFYREGSGSSGGICWGDEEVQVEASSSGWFSNFYGGKPNGRMERKKRKKSRRNTKRKNTRRNTRRNTKRKDTRRNTRRNTRSKTRKNI